MYPCLLTLACQSCTLKQSGNTLQIYRLKRCRAPHWRLLVNREEAAVRAQSHWVSGEIGQEEEVEKRVQEEKRAAQILLLVGVETGVCEVCTSVDVLRHLFSVTCDIYCSLTCGLTLRFLCFSPLFKCVFWKLLLTLVEGLGEKMHTLLSPLKQICVCEYGQYKYNLIDWFIGASMIMVSYQIRVHAQVLMREAGEVVVAFKQIKCAP